jgi:hypothetical protein
MRDHPTPGLGRFFKKAREGDDLLHAPFRVTTHRGHTVQTFQSLELALEAAEAPGQDHYVIDRHGSRSGTSKENCCVTRNNSRGGKGPDPSPL